jgi:hypothetical protein
MPDRSLSPSVAATRMVASSVASSPEGRSPSRWARLMMPATRSIQPGPDGVGELGYAAQVAGQARRAVRR